MKKIVLTLVCAVCIMLIFPLKVCAHQSADSAESDYSQRISERLNEAVDDETKQTIAEDPDLGDPQKLSLSGILSALWNALAEQMTEPLRVFARLCAVIMLSSLAASMARGGASQTFSAVSVLGSVTVIYGSVYAAFQSVCGFLDRLGEFMLAYIPIYASVTAASGRLTEGGGYYASTLGVCELIAFVSNRLIMPFLSVFMALSFTAAINPNLRFSSAAESLKNAVRFTLTALMTIFTGMITIKSFSGAAADGAAARAVKFGASNFIPIIGSSVSEAYSTVYAGVGVIRSSVGTLGIVAAGVMMLKPFAELICIKIVLGMAKLIADLLGACEISELLKSTGYAISAALSTMLCFCMMFIISTAVVMMASGTN